MKYVRPFDTLTLDDVAIAGGGPAGTSLAFQLASRGLDVHLLEEHPSLGSPSHCAGLIGPGMGDIPVIGKIVRDCTINKLRGAVFVSPGGAHFEVQGDRGSALVIDRKVFDRRIAR